MNKNKRYIRAEHTVVDNKSCFCYVSGRQVLDEGLLDGGYVMRYRNCMGQIEPDTHLSGSAPQPLELYSSFLIEVNHKPVAGNWAFESFGKADDNSFLRGEAQVWALRLYDDKAEMAVTVYTRLDGSDFIVRWLEIENRSNKAIGITGVNPYGGAVWNFGLRPEAVGDGASFAAAYTHLKDWGHEGDFLFDTIDEPVRVFSDHGKSGMGRPAVWLRNLCNGETLVCEYAWSGNWQIVAEAPDKSRSLLCLKVGMLPSENEVLRVLLPHESVMTPAVHFALFRDGDDEIVQHTHEHVRRTVLPPLPEGVPVMEIEANHRGYLCDHESEEGIKRDIDIAKAAGCELYVVDAGWHGTDELNEWWNNAGDWYAGPWMKNGFEPIPRYVHEKGMRFGLWAEIEASGGHTRLRREHPEWSAARDGIPLVDGRVLDLSKPEVEAFCLGELCRLTEQYHLDMYRIDHNHSMGLGGQRQYEGFTENTLWRYYEAFGRILRELRRKYPSLVLQNCAGGGGRLDWGTMSLFHNTELSDWLRQPRGIRLLNGVSMSLPPEILLRTYGTETDHMAADGDFATQCRAAMICRPILRGIAPSTERLTPYLSEGLNHQISLFKEFTRPMMENCLVWHHTPFQPIMVPAAYTIFEYSSPDRDRTLVAVFSGNEAGKEPVTVYPHSVCLGRKYKVTFDNTGESAVLDGYILKTNGLRITVAQAMCSEFIKIELIQE